MNEEEGERGDAMSRIFIGGLGTSVTGDDLERIFSSFGRIHGLDIIRTNDRSFAYVNLQPADEKSLAKLFSLYNGCTWKGGRLRLEKAKEHYLARLHREWATDAAQSVTDFVDANTPVEVQEQTNMTPERNGLKIFFPRQKKVKVLPRKGTGKHKYSFQRVESVPVTQLLRCGCDEHKMHIEQDGNNEIDVDMNNAMPETQGVTEKELNIMKKVMEELIGNEEQMQTSTELGNKTEVGHAYTPAKWARGKVRIGMERFDDEDDTEGVSDGEAVFRSADALAATIKVKENSREKDLENLEAFKDKSKLVIKDSGDEKSLSRGLTENMASKNAHEPPSTKAKFRVAKLGQKNLKREIHSGVHNNMKSSPTEGNDGKPGILKLNESKRLKVEDGVCSSIQHNETRNNLSIDIGQEISGSTSSKGHDNGTVTEVQDGSCSRVQKTSWKDLVGETGRVSFSLSSIIGGAGSSPYLVKDRESKTLGALENSPKHARQEISRDLPDRSGKNVIQKGHKSSNDKGSHSFLKDRESKTLGALENSPKHARQEISRDLPDRSGKNVIQKGHKGAGSSPYLVKDRESKTLGALENSPKHARQEISRDLPDRSGKNVIQKGHKSSNDKGSHSFLSGLVVKAEDSESQKSEPIAEMKNEHDTIKEQEVPKDNFTEKKVEDKNCYAQVDKDLHLSGQETDSSALCMFMRSENAEAEWLKSKAAVQRYAKFRKKIAPKSIKK